MKLWELNKFYPYLAQKLKMTTLIKNPSRLLAKNLPFFVSERTLFICTLCPTAPRYKGGLYTLNFPIQTHFYPPVSLHVPLRDVTTDYLVFSI